MTFDGFRKQRYLCTVKRNVPYGSIVASTFKKGTDKHLDQTKTIRAKYYMHPIRKRAL